MASAFSQIDELESLKALFFTWNVGNKMPLASELEHWCPERGGDFDLIVVGTQENRFKRRGRDSQAPSTDRRKSMDSMDDRKLVASLGTAAEDGDRATVYEDADLDEVAVDFEEEAIEAGVSLEELSASCRAPNTPTAETSVVMSTAQGDLRSSSNSRKNRLSNIFTSASTPQNGEEETGNIWDAMVHARLGGPGGPWAVAAHVSCAACPLSAPVDRCDAIRDVRTSLSDCSPLLAHAPSSPAPRAVDGRWCCGSSGSRSMRRKNGSSLRPPARAPSCTRCRRRTPRRVWAAFWAIRAESSSSFASWILPFVWSLPTWPRTRTSSPREMTTARRRHTALPALAPASRPHTVVPSQRQITAQGPLQQRRHAFPSLVTRQTLLWHAPPRGLPPRGGSRDEGIEQLHQPDQ